LSPYPKLAGCTIGTSGGWQRKLTPMELSGETGQSPKPNHTGIIVRSIWFAWLASLVLLANRSTHARFVAAFTTGMIVTGLLLVSGSAALVWWWKQR